MCFIIVCGDSSDPENKLVGSWGVFNNIEGCYYIYHLNNDDKYEVDYVCQLESGEYAAEGEGGNYTMNGDKVTFTPTGSTCSDADRSAYEASYDLLDENLRLVFNSTGLVVSLKPVYKNTDEEFGSILIGCFDDEGYFTRSSFTKF